MDIRQLKYVLEVAKCKNFSTAASNLYVTQSALSQQIRTVEKELGTSLFYRSTHHVQLTSSGYEFCFYAKKVISAMDDLQQAFSKSNIADDISLGLFPFYMKVGLQNTITSFISQHPDISATIHVYDTYQVYENLRNNNLDIAIVKSNRANLLDEFSYNTLISEKLHVIMSDQFPQAQLSEISPDVLKELPLLSGEKTSYLYYRSKEYFAANSINLNVRVYNTKNVDMMIEMIKDGIGVILATDSVGKSLKDEGIAYVPVTPVDYVETLLVYRKEPLSKSAELFKEYIIKEYKKETSL